MTDLTAPLHEHLRDPIDDRNLKRVHARLQRNRRRQRRARGLKPAFVISSVAAGALIGTAVAALLWHGVGDRAPARDLVGPVRLAGGAALTSLSVDARAPGPASFGLDDGTTLRLEPGACVVAEENTGRVVVLRLEAGRASFAVAHDRYELFRVRSGEVAVDVVGTRFSVALEPERVLVEVEEGVVQVQGGPVTTRRRLARGETLVVELRPAMAGGAGAPARAYPDAARPSEPVEPTPPAVAPGARRSWRALAQKRAFGEAYELLGPAGVGRESRLAEGPDDLFALADVARLSGHPADAVAPLERIVEAYQGDGRASLAAFTLGRLHLDVLAQPALAASDFERALRLGAPSDLREDAHARLVEARARAGDDAGARAAAQDYLRLFPDGRHAEQVRALAGPGAP
jgi:transmembrane sensor